MLNTYGIEDSGGANVQPQTGSVRPMTAAPSYAEGGAIPDGDDDDTNEAAGNTPNTDVTDYSGAMSVIRQAMNYGRQKNGLPTSQVSTNQQQPQQPPEAGIPDTSQQTPAQIAGFRANATNMAIQPKPQAPQKDDSAIPDDSSSDDGGDSGDGGDASYAEGGAIDDNTPATDAMGNVQGGADAPEAGGALPGNNDNSGAAPVQGGGFAPDPQSGDNSGAAPSVATPLQYLQGTDAMPDPQAKALETSVSSDANHEPNAKTMLAAQKANETGGPPAAFAYLQRSRKIYDASMSHARAALSGVQGRPPSLNAAVESATKAYVNMPEPTDIKFSVNRDGSGITASVKDLNTDKAQQYNLTPQQFGQAIDITKDGQFDRVMAAGGMGSLLQKLTAGNQPASGDGEDNASRLRAPENSDADRATTMGHDVTLLTSPSYNRKNPEAVAQSRARPERIFTQDERDEMAKTPAEKRQDELLEGKYKSAENVARLRKGPARDYTAEEDQKYKHKVDLENTKQTNLNSRAKLRSETALTNTQLRELNALDKNLQLGTLTPEQKAYRDQLVIQKHTYGVEGQGAPAAQNTPRQITPQDQGALLWAKANPNDPRAAKIKQLLGQ